jgi:hypothetical protein
MVYRALEITNKENKEKIQVELEEKIKEFIEETQEKKYVLSCSAILCYKKKEYEQTNDWKKSKGFFCSQLIAAAYLKCGIMNYNKGSNGYLPGSFGHNKNLHITDNYSLGPEIIIDFSA